VGLSFFGMGCPAEGPDPGPENENGNPTVLAVFDADYRDTFVEVRDCRFSATHGGANIRVLVNPVGLEAYLADENPLPLGSIVLKEEYSAADCSDEADLVNWSVMLKEAPGFDSENGDWHWQFLAADREVLEDVNTRCLPCHLAPECVARDYMCTEP